MKGQRQIARFLAAAILLIVFALAPSLAEAHAGHNHGAAAASSTQAAHAAADEVAAPEKATGAVPAEWRASSDSVSNSQEAPCTMGCCSGFSCTACSALMIPESISVGLLTPCRIFEVPEINALSGLIPNGLRRPPRSFA
jgi:hypothetical protein